MSEGPVTPAYGQDVQEVIRVLNDVIATELVSFLSYQQHASVITGAHAPLVAATFSEHAQDELQHALTFAARVKQLGGAPNLDPSTLATRSYVSYQVYLPTEFTAMLKENLLAERIVVQVYQGIIRWLSAGDPSSRRLFERVLEEEEAHAVGLRALLASSPDSRA
jgi:bacterioferritin